MKRFNSWKFLPLMLIGFFLCSCASYNKIIHVDNNLNLKANKDITVIHDINPFEINDSIFYCHSYSPAKSVLDDDKEVTTFFSKNNYTTKFEITESDGNTEILQEDVHIFNQLTLENTDKYSILNSSVLDSTFAINDALYFKAINNANYRDSLVVFRFHKSTDHVSPLGKGSYKDEKFSGYIVPLPIRLGHGFFAYKYRKGEVKLQYFVPLNFENTISDIEKLFETSLQNEPAISIIPDVAYITYKINKYNILIDHRVGTLIFDVFLLGLPTFLGRPSVSSTCDMNVSFNLFDREGKLIKTFNTDATSKADMAFYHGYGDIYLQASILKASKSALTNFIKALPEQ
jgi:hypothetical protein